jgi:hypothetical protein
MPTCATWRCILFSLMEEPPPEIEGLDARDLGFRTNASATAWFGGLSLLPQRRVANSFFLLEAFLLVGAIGCINTTTETRQESFPVATKVESRPTGTVKLVPSAQVDEQGIVVETRGQPICREQTVTTFSRRLVTATLPATEHDRERLKTLWGGAAVGALFAVGGLGAAPFLSDREGTDEQGKATASPQQRALVLGAVGGIFALGFGIPALVSSLRLRSKSVELPPEPRVTADHELPCQSVPIVLDNLPITLRIAADSQSIGSTGADGFLKVPFRSLSAETLDLLFREQSLQIQIESDPYFASLRLALQPDILEAIDALRVAGSIVLLRCEWTDDENDVYVTGNGNGRIDDEESVHARCRLANRSAKATHPVRITVEAEDSHIKIRLFSSRAPRVWAPDEEGQVDFGLVLHDYAGSDSLPVTLILSRPEGADRRRIEAGIQRLRQSGQFDWNAVR